MNSIKGTLKEKIAILRLKQGDSEAFGYLYDIYVDKIYRYVYFRISESSTAYDITQEVFLQAWESIIKEKIVKNLQSYVYKIAYHKVVDFYRLKGRQAALIDDVNESEFKSDLNETELNAELRILQQHVAKLKPEYQDVLILKHVEGLSINEIAEIVSMDPNNVRVSIHRAMNSLKKIYSE